MSVAATADSRARVARVLSGLGDRFGSVPVVDDEWVVASDAYERTRSRHVAGTVGGAGTWTTRADGAVLLVREDAGGAWSEPAGKQEPEESLVETAVRETHEETGVSVRVDGVGFVQHVRTVDAADDSRPTIHRLVTVFEATPTGECTSNPSAADDSVVAARWWRERPDELAYDALDTLPFPDAP